MRVHAAKLAWLVLTATGSAANGVPADPGLARPAGPCAENQVCRFDEPEDLADLVGTDWLIVSEAAGQRRSGLAAFNTASGRIERFGSLAGVAPCRADARGGGIGMRREGRGYRLLRILHAGAAGEPDAVETYRVTIVSGTPHLVRTACIPAPAAYFLNDIAPLADGGFAATHMFNRTVPRAAREVAFLARRPTGFVVRWSPVGGWRRLPGTDGTFPNGIDASADGRWLAFAETYGRAINRIRPDGSGRIRLPLAMQPDNVTALPGGRFLVAGGTGAPLTSTRRCPELRRLGCAFPALAARIDFAHLRVAPIVVSRGERTPGFSVAVVKDGRVYLGTAFGDRVTTVRMDQAPATLP